MHTLCRCVCVSNDNGSCVCASHNVVLVMCIYLQRTAGWIKDILTHYESYPFLCSSIENTCIDLPLKKMYIRLLLVEFEWKFNDKPMELELKLKKM